ncbi:MAG: class I SAM-dependent methyltransferase [Pseudomonadota bacterium]
MSDDETISVYNAQAARYETMVSNDAPDRHLRAFMDALPARAKVLDLGAGPGNSTRMMQAQGFDSQAWDASPAFVEMAQAAGVPARLALFADLAETAMYDGIFANFSLLHAPREDMPGNLSRISKALKPGGVFHLGLKTGQGEDRDRLGRFYSYFSASELHQMLRQEGFETLSEDHGNMNGNTPKNTTTIPAATRSRTL